MVLSSLHPDYRAPVVLPQVGLGFEGSKHPAQYDWSPVPAHRPPIAHLGQGIPSARHAAFPSTVATIGVGDPKLFQFGVRLQQLLDQPLGQSGSALEVIQLKGPELLNSANGRTGAEVPAVL